MKLSDWLAIILLVVLAITRIFFSGDDAGEEQQVRRPAPPPPPVKAVPAPAPAPQETQPLSPNLRELNGSGVVVHEEERSKPSIGTAFALAHPNIWMTARHVTDNCRRLLLVDRKSPSHQWRRLGTVEEVIAHPRADLSIFKATLDGPVLGLGGQDLVTGQPGYHFGFPQSKPASVHSKLLGRTRIRHTGGLQALEPVLAWAEVRRKPFFSGSLGGISGGPVMDGQGRVIGVNVAEVPRRGRIETSSPGTLREILRRSGVRAQTAGGSAASKPDLTPERFDRYGKDLRRQGSIVRVVCLID